MVPPLWSPFLLLFAMRQTPLVVVFGRPGAGKTTVAEKAVDLANCNPLLVDLDVCVPQWMKDNFAKGIYPSLQERQEFALSACDHVEECRQEDRAQVVAFSFVNTDLRDTFRLRFPHSIWVLVDTSEGEAQHRIEQRQGHFFKVRDQETKSSDWEFAPVAFSHTVLEGTALVEDNAKRVVEIIEQAIQVQYKL
jgi:gluconate kinase